MKQAANPDIKAAVFHDIRTVAGPAPETDNFYAFAYN
jgi:hypothetical protein